MDWVAILAELPALAAGVGVILAVARWLAKKVDRGLTLLTAIEAEFRPNGGGSMRDQIGQLKSMIWALTARQVARDEVNHDPMFEADSQGNVVRANSALQKLAQRGADAFLGSGWELIVAEHDRDRVWDAWSDAIQRRRAFESSFDLIAADGTRYSVDCVATPIREGDTVTGWVGKYRIVEQQQDTRRKRRA